MSGFLGVLAGVGDAMHEKNVQDQRQQYAMRKDFADQLEKIGADESNWTETAREAALRARLHVLSPAGQKLKQKDYDNLWNSVLQASTRTVDGAAERNAERSNIPALQNLESSADSWGQSAQQNAQSQPAPPQYGATPSVNTPSSSTVPGTHIAPQPAPPSTPSLLGPAGYDPSQAHSLSNQTIQNYGLSAEPTTRQGMYSRSEKSQHQMELLKQQIAAWSALNGGGSGGGMALSMNAKGGVSARMTNPAYSDNEYSYIDADGQAQTGPLVLSHGTGKYVDASGRAPKSVLHKMRTDSVIGHMVQGSGGQPVEQFENRNELAGKSFNTPVRDTFFNSTDNKGNTYRNTQNPYSGSITQRIQSGQMNNADLIRVLKQQGIEKGYLQMRNLDLARMKGEYNLRGSFVDEHGDLIVPALTPLDENGEPASPMAFKLSAPTTAQRTRGIVAGDAIFAANQVLNKAKAAESSFGSFAGKSVNFLIEHGMIEDTDVQSLRAAFFSLTETQPQVHAMRNFAMAEKAAEILGNTGQPYENFVAGIQTLMEFLKRVQESGRTPSVSVQQSTKRDHVVRAAPGPGNATPQLSPEQESIQRSLDALGNIFAQKPKLGGKLKAP